MILHPLEAQDAESIAALAADFYPEEMHLEAEEIAQSLRAADEEGGNFSAGLLHQGHLCGYMLAWLEESRLEGVRESVILIDDVAVATGSLADLQRLFRNLISQIEESGLSHLAIEGSLLPDTRDTFLGQRRFFSSLGYELVASQDYWEDDLGVELTWVRYERPVEVEAAASSECWDGSEFGPDDEEFDEFPE
jgi:hypothetical protein